MNRKTNIVIGILIIVALIQITVLYVRNNFEVSGGRKFSDDNSEKIKIGLVLGTLKEERWIKDRDIIISKGIEKGAEVIVQNANNNDEEQINQVKYLIGIGIDVLIIVPNDYQKVAEAVQLCKEKGIPVISYDRLVMNSDIDLYISFDNEMVGEFMAKAVLKSSRTGNVLIINGAKNDYNTTFVKNGYMRVLEPAINSGKINIIDIFWSDNWLKENAYKYTKNTILQGVKIDAIICGNDSLAEGSIEALSEHKLVGKIVVTGQDADLSACQRIVEGSQLMTVYKPIEKLASKAVEYAISLAKGEEIRTEKTIWNGKMNVPYYPIEPIYVDKNNIDETVIKDGFHLREEVYYSQK